MIPFIIVVILLAALGILGAVVKGLLWLTFIAALLIVGAVGFGYFKFRSTKSGSA